MCQCHSSFFLLTIQSPREKSSDLQSLLIFSSSSLAVFILILIIADGSGAFSASAFCEAAIAHFSIFSLLSLSCSFLLEPASVLFLIAQLFLNTVIFAFPFLFSSSSVFRPDPAPHCENEKNLHPVCFHKYVLLPF